MDVERANHSIARQRALAKGATTPGPVGAAAARPRPGDDAVMARWLVA